MFNKLAKYAIAIPLLGGAGMIYAADPAIPSKDRAGQHDQRAMVLVRAEKLIGMNIYNADGKKLGDVEDIVLNGDANHVRYVVVSYGGVLGIGDKLFAVPWHALEYRSLEPTRLFMNVDVNTLKNAPGFDKKNWPDMAEPTFRESVHKFYSTNDRDRNRDLDRDAVTDDSQAKNAPEKKGLLWYRRVSDLKGADVKNPQGEKLGDVKDLVIDAYDGRVQYAVVTYGGILGIGDKYFAVPIAALHSDPQKKELILNTTKDHLKNAPGFNQKDWPNFADPQFRSSIDDFYKDGIAPNTAANR